MDNEKYGIELELVTNKFSKKLQQVKKEVNSLKKVKRLEDYADISKAPISAWKQWASENQRVNKSLKQTQSNFKGIQPLSEKFVQRTETGLKNLTGNIKRFGLALLSIRSIWALVSRASSAYLAQDTELAGKLQSVWVGLGAILAPVIELIAGLIAKAVTFINYLIKALTGVDLIAKATTKSVKGTTGAVKGLNKALASFE